MDLWVTERYRDQIGYAYKVKETLFHGQSDFQTVDIVDTDFYGRMLLLDGLMMTTERDEFIYHEMISHISLLAHPNPRRILVIGGGDGGTVREVLKHPTVESVVLCEIDGLVIDACRTYLPGIAGQLDHPKVEILVRDGIAYIQECQNMFDVVLIDSTDPIGPGEGLFTQDFYQNVYNALTPQGIMVNQSESPWAMQPQVKKVYALLRKVFPVVKPYIATVPTYPGSYWSWAFCSKGILPLEAVNNDVAAQLEKTTRFYNREIHQAVFALPNFIQDLFRGEVEPAITGTTATGTKTLC